MKAKLFLSLMLNCFVCLPAVSQQVTMFGGGDCGQWVATSKSNASLKHWLVGYMSGLNAGMSSEKNDPLNKLNSAEQIFLWMDNFCTKNPLKTISNGGNALFYELRDK